MESKEDNKNKASVVIAECSTGIVHKLDLTHFRTGIDNETEMYQYFDNIDDAKGFAKQFTNDHPEFECCVYDCNDKPRFIITNLEENAIV